MKISNCCGAYGVIKTFDTGESGDCYHDSEEAGICSECGEHCEYVCEDCRGEGEVERNIVIDGIEMDVMVVCSTCQPIKY